jgi:hypothetical protein
VSDAKRLRALERVTLTPEASPGFSQDYIDWSHSLLTSVVWSVVFGALSGTPCELAAARRLGCPRAFCTPRARA